MLSFAFDHIHIKTTDTLGCAEFLRDVLQGSPVGQIEPGKRAVLDLAGLRVFIDPADTAARDGVLEHIALAVDDMDGFVRHVLAGGHTFEREPAELRPGLVAAFLRTPGNVLIEVLKRS